MNKSNAPQIISLSTADLEKLLGELRGPLAPTTYQLVESLLRTLQWVMAALEQKSASLGRLRRIIFGEKTEKACKILPATIAAILSGPTKPKARGHGRNGAKDYPAAQRVQVVFPLWWENYSATRRTGASFDGLWNDPFEQGQHF